MRWCHIPILLSVAACGYQAGSFQHPVADFDGARRTVGCIDVAVASYVDRSTRGPAAALTLGNRCDAAVLVDLRMPAAARYSDGRTVKVRPRDPDGEIHPVYLEARSVAREYIEYALPEGAPAPGRLCLDLSGVDAEVSRQRDAVVCVGDGEKSTRTAEVTR